MTGGSAVPTATKRLIELNAVNKLFSSRLLYLHWSSEVAIAPGAFDFMAHPNDGQNDPQQNARQHEPRPGIALPGLRLATVACGIVHLQL